MHARGERKTSLALCACIPKRRAGVDKACTRQRAAEMVEREKQDKTNVSRTIEQRQIAAPCVTHACASRFFSFFFGEE